jgi:hypothetical protein
VLEILVTLATDDGAFDVPVPLAAAERGTVTLLLYSAVAVLLPFLPPPPPLLIVMLTEFETGAAEEDDVFGTVDMSVGNSSSRDILWFLTARAT